MERLFASGAAVDVVLGVIVLEFAALLAMATAGARRARAVDLVFALAPGACILLALRAALTGGGWATCAFWLAASFPFHLVDLMRRRL